MSASNDRNSRESGEYERAPHATPRDYVVAVALAVGVVLAVLFLGRPA